MAAESSEQLAGRGRLLSLFIYAAILASACMQVSVVPILPAYAHRFELSGLDQGMLLAATGLATLAVSVPAGALSDRFGARRVTIWSVALMALAALLQAVAPSFGFVLVARLVFGVGYGIVWTAGLAWLADRGGQRSLGGTVASAGIGGIVGPALFGVLTQYFGLGVPFLGSAAFFAAVTAALALTKLPDPAPTRSSASLSTLVTAISDRRTMAAGAGIVVVTMIAGVSNLLVPDELHAAGGSLGIIGLAFSASGLLFSIGSIVTASLGKRAVRLAVAFVSMMAVALFVSPALLSSAPIAVVIMLCATTTARSVVWTVSYPLGADGAERSGVGVGVVMGLLNGIWAATAVASPLVAGLAADHAGARAVFGVTELAGVILAGAAFLTARRIGGVGALGGASARS